MVTIYDKGKVIHEETDGERAYIRELEAL